MNVVTSGTHNQCQAIVTKFGLKFYLNCYNESLKVKNKEMIENILWGIGNLSGDCDENKEDLLKNGFFERLTSLIEEKSKDFLDNSTILENAVWTLANLCRDKSENNLQLYRAAPIFCNIVLNNYTNLSIISDSAWALLQLTINYLGFKNFK